MSISAVTMARDFPEPCNRPQKKEGKGGIERLVA